MSIRVRLALWYSAVFGLVLAIFGMTLYALMAQHLEAMVSDTLQDETVHIVNAIHAPRETEASGQGIQAVAPDTLQASGVYAQILDADGSVLARSSNLGDRTLPIPSELSRPSEFTTELDGLRLRSSITPVDVGDAIMWVEVAASYRQRDLTLERLRWALLGGGLSAVGATGLLTWLLAGRALRPVFEMAETARAIALSRGFGRRLSVSSPDDELGQLAQTFNEMLASLEEAYTAQQRFTADASHELRAPLTAIRGNLDLLDRIRDLPEEERQQMLAQVRREVNRLSRLVNDLLSLARADAGQALRLRPVEMDSVLVEAHRQALAMANGVEVHLEHLEPAIVQGDEDRLRELLLILLDNALRYTPEGGKVRMWLKQEPPWVVVGVEDTGIGIEQRDLPHIFDRFWRADRARSRDRGGTGLGLSIAKWIVEQHGGEILTASEPGKGSRFTVHLPAYSDDTP